MAVSTWPTTLPQVPQKGYTETGGVLILRTPTDAGPAKMRRRGESPQGLNVSFLMSGAQVSSFEDFVKTTLRGVKRFNFPHPRLKSGTPPVPTSVEVRIVPQGSGDLYTLTYAAPDYWTVSMQLEILP